MGFEGTKVDQASIAPQEFDWSKINGELPVGFTYLNPYLGDLEVIPDRGNYLVEALARYSESDPTNLVNNADQLKVVYQDLKDNPIQVKEIIEVLIGDDEKKISAILGYLEQLFSNKVLPIENQVIFFRDNGKKDTLFKDFLEKKLKADYQNWKEFIVALKSTIEQNKELLREIADKNDAQREQKDQGQRNQKIPTFTLIEDSVNTFSQYFELADQGATLESAPVESQPVAAETTVQ